MKITPGIKVFITGSASGIGRQTALELARRGARLFLTDINPKGLEETVELAGSLGGEVCKYRAFDISDYQAVRQFADEVHQEYGAMEIIMNIAGIALYAFMEDMDHSHWEKLIRVNLFGPIHTIECFVPEMIKAKRGYIVNVSSASGLLGLPIHSAYASAKFGLVGLSEVLLFDLEPHNIKVSVICPGAVDTPLVDTVEVLGIDPQNPKVKKFKQSFRERASTPNQVAQAIIKAVEKEQFLVIPSRLMKFLYFSKKFLPFLYHYILRRLAYYAYSLRYPQGKQK